MGGEQRRSVSAGAITVTATSQALFDWAQGVPPIAHKPSRALRPGLRYYQNDDVDAVQRVLEREPGALVVSATGLGKTQSFVALAYEWTQGRVLFIVHRKELIDQIANRIIQMSGRKLQYGRDVGIEQAELSSARNNQFVIASNMTACRKERLDRMAAQGGFGLIIIDESHRATMGTKTYAPIIKAFPDAKVVGFTATPDRLDGISLKDTFGTVAVRRDIRDGIEMGYLVPPKAKHVYIKEVNLDVVATRGADFVARDLDEQVAKGAAAIAKETVDRAGERQTIIFCPGISSAKLVAEMIRNRTGNPESAVSIDQGTDPVLRDAYVRGFRNGKHQFFVNVLIAIEGFDAPATSCIVIAASTMSRARYTQQIGRGARVLPGTIDHLDGAENAEARREAIKASKKPDFLVLDMVGNCTKHNLIGPADIMAGRSIDPDAIAKAKEMAQRDEPVDVLDALEQAEREAELERAREELLEKERQASQMNDAERKRIAGLLNQSSIRSMARDVDIVHGANGSDDRGEMGARGPAYADAATIKKLREYGWNDEDFKARGIKHCLKVMRSRDNNDVISLRAMRSLMRYGIPYAKLTAIPKEKGRDAFRYLSGAAWRPNRKELAEILGIGE